MQWNFTGSRPVYQQIMEQFRAAVLAGQYLPGSRIPSVRDLAVEAKVNPNTMQRALAELEREQLLVSHGTSGRCVTAEVDVLDGLRRDAVEQLVRDCARKFREAGLNMEQAAAMLLALEEKEEG